MERVAFNLMAYTAHVGRERRERFTLETGPLPVETRPAGRILAPAGSELYGGIPGKSLLLKVPKAGRPHEYHALDAQEAYRAAQAGEYGLTLEREGIGGDQAL